MKKLILAVVLAATSFASSANCLVGTNTGLMEVNLENGIQFRAINDSAANKMEWCSDDVTSAVVEGIEGRMVQNVFNAVVADQEKYDVKPTAKDIKISLDWHVMAYDSLSEAGYNRIVVALEKKYGVKL